MYIVHVAGTEDVYEEVSLVHGSTRGRERRERERGGGGFMV